jgi:hypothetical protein
LAVVAWHADPTFTTMALVKPLLASLAVSGLLGLLSLCAWPREGAWVRLLRLSGLLWVTALARIFHTSTERRQAGAPA